MVAPYMKRDNDIADLDYYPTPAWATRALLKYVPSVSGATCLEPACGAGHMSRALLEVFPEVRSYDIADRGYGKLANFLTDDFSPVDWVITNPPYNVALDFVKKSLLLSSTGVAMFLRSTFAESAGRYEELFRDTPPTTIAQFVERVGLVKNGVVSKANACVPYAWFVWDKRQGGRTDFVWLPPCKKALERPEDYS